MRKTMRNLAASGLVIAIVTSLAQQLAAQSGTQADTQTVDVLIPAELGAATVADPNWTAPKLSWGHPNLEGTFTSRDMSGIPLE